MKKYAAEFIGTFSLVLFGCGSAVIAGISTTGPIGIGLLGLQSPLASRLSRWPMPSAGSRVVTSIRLSPSGIDRRENDGKDAIGYIIAQCLGAILGAAVLYLIAVGRPGFTMPEWGLGANGWGEGYLGNYNILSAFVIEAVMTFLFIFVILGTTSKFGTAPWPG